MSKRSSKHLVAVVSFVVGLAALAVPASARADGDDDHLAFSMGFLSGSRTYQATPFEVQGGAGARLLGSDARAPFRSGAFDRVPMYGLRYDVRMVLSPVRMTAGFDFPFTSVPAATHVALGGVDRTVTVDALRAYDLRFGIGLEPPTRRVVPFVDLVGAVHWTKAALLLDGERVDYGATTFVYSVRGGVRVDLRKAFFLVASGEVGVTGDVRWSTELSVGFQTF